MRSQVVNSNKAIYGVCWSPENDLILYASEKMLTILPTLPGKQANLVESPRKYRPCL